MHSISGITYLGAILDGAGTERRSGRVYSPSTCFFFDFDEMATSGLKMYDNCNSSMVAREIRQLYHTIRLTSDGYAEIVFSHYVRQFRCFGFYHNSLPPPPIYSPHNWRTNKTIEKQQIRHSTEKQQMRNLFASNIFFWFSKCIPDI